MVVTRSYFFGRGQTIASKTPAITIGDTSRTTTIINTSNGPSPNTRMLLIVAYRIDRAIGPAGPNPIVTQIHCFIRRRGQLLGGKIWSVPGPLDAVNLDAPTFADKTK